MDLPFLKGPPSPKRHCAPWPLILHFLLQEIIEASENILYRLSLKQSCIYISNHCCKYVPCLYFYSFPIVFWIYLVNSSKFCRLKPARVGRDGKHFTPSYWSPEVAGPFQRRFVSETRYSTSGDQENKLLGFWTEQTASSWNSCYTKVKWGWRACTTFTVRDTYTLAVLCSVTQPFSWLHSYSWRALRAVLKGGIVSGIEPLDLIMANFCRSSRSTWFPLLSACRFVESDTSIICHVFMHCFGSFSDCKLCF